MSPYARASPGSALVIAADSAGPISTSHACSSAVRRMRPRDTTAQVLRTFWYLADVATRGSRRDRALSLRARHVHRTDWAPALRPPHRFARPRLRSPCDAHAHVFRPRACGQRMPFSRSQVIIAARGNRTISSTGREPPDRFLRPSRRYASPYLARRSRASYGRVRALAADVNRSLFLIDSPCTSPSRCRSAYRPRPSTCRRS